MAGEIMLTRPAVFLLCLAPPLFLSEARPLASEIPKPVGKVILIVEGNVARTNGEGRASFDRALIERLTWRTVRTSTNWTEGVKVFEGVSARELLAFVGAQGETASAVALNDYKVDIPIADFEQYDVLFALRMDGKDLLPSDKGPIWIVYPRDQKPGLRDLRYDSRWVWQLRTLTIR